MPKKKAPKAKIKTIIDELHERAGGAASLPADQLLETYADACLQCLHSDLETALDAVEELMGEMGNVRLTAAYDELLLEVNVEEALAEMKPKRGKKKRAA